MIMSELSWNPDTLEDHCTKSSHYCNLSRLIAIYFFFSKRKARNSKEHLTPYPTMKTAKGEVRLHDPLCGTRKSNHKLHN